VASGQLILAKISGAGGWPGDAGSGSAGARKEALLFPAGSYFPATSAGVNLGKFGPHKDYLG